MARTGVEDKEIEEEEEEVELEPEQIRIKYRMKAEGIDPKHGFDHVPTRDEIEEEFDPGANSLEQLQGFDYFLVSYLQSGEPLSLPR